MAEPKKIHVILENTKSDKPSWPIANLLLPFIAAVAGTIAVLVMDVFKLQETQRSFKSEQSRLAKEFRVIQDREERRLALSEHRLLSELVIALQKSTDYDTRRRAIALIAETFDVKQAISVEAFNRTGATVRALQDLAAKFANQTQSEEALVSSALKSALEAVPTALFIDSAFNNNPYCESSKGNQRTNIDDIFPIVRHLPLKFTAERISYSDFGPDDAQELRKRIISSKPELIVIHNGAFDGSVFGEGKISSAMVTDFLAPIFETYFPSVIVYSRSKDFSDNAPDWFSDFGSNSPYFEKLNVEVPKSEKDSSKNRDCFAVGKPNGTRILQAIERALATTETYRLGLR